MTTVLFLFTVSAIAQGTMNLTPSEMKGKFLSETSGPWKAALGSDQNGGSHATLGKTPAGFNSGFHTHSATYHAVILEGEIENDYKGQKNPGRTKKGGYFAVIAGTPHVTKCV